MAIAGIAAILLAGCNSRPTLESSATAFSVGGLALGMPRADVERAHALQTCQLAGNDITQCRVDDSARRYTFFGLPVGAALVDVGLSSAEVVAIRLSIPTGTVQKAGVETAWALQGRCLAASDAGGDAAGVLAREGLLPHGLQDFMCVGPGRRYLRYTALGSDGAGVVEMGLLPMALYRQVDERLVKR